MQRLIPTGDAARPVAFAEVAQPVPEPGEALIKVQAFAPNRGETFLLENPRPELLPGKDIAGLVVQAAADGSGPGIGTRVVGHPAQGGWTEYASVPTHSLAVLPDGIDSARAAALPLAGITALRLLRTAVSLAGRRVLLTGAYAGSPYGCDLAALVSLVEQGRLHPEISSIAGWAQTADTLVDLRERRIRGKAVLLTGGAR
ncbi:alcohol dehydrogenase catalytic domain-containing protein [Streptomyces sp. NPDC056921]|uniref:alcohol dehydrogenase catalytic domain-containing protein n=1 Tax=Streptomyces sp. NPDC056921 TaxID=3345966 RepID=UPI00363DA25D